MTRALALLLPLALLACESIGEVVPERPTGVPVEVEILDDGFVMFEGERIPYQFFLIEMRERVRADFGSPERMPAVTVYVADGAPGVDGIWISMLREELEIAGVPHLTLGHR